MFFPGEALVRDPQSGNTTPEGAWELRQRVKVPCHDDASKDVDCYDGKNCGRNPRNC
jgi:hypothetical protein